MKCITKKVFNKYKSHQLTKKNVYEFKHHITKYLSPEQIMSLKCKRNDVQNYKKKRTPNESSPCTKKILSNIMSHVEPLKEIIFINQEESFYSITKNYPTYYYKREGKEYVVLDVNKLSKDFDFFKIGHVEISPSREYLIFNVDFVGNRLYHLFIKHLFSDEIVELKTFVLPKKMLSVHEVFDKSNSDFFVWLNDHIICYTINNISYNIHKTYCYDIFTQKNTLVYQNKHTFVHIKPTLDYNLLYDLDYNSDEVYLLEDKKTFPLIKRKKDVSYPFIQQYDGIWYIHEKNKGNDIIKTTQNFKTFKVLYKNEHPHQTISQCIVYHNKIYFILSDHAVYVLDPIPKKIVEDEIHFFKFGNIYCDELDIIRHSYLTPEFTQHYNIRTHRLSPYKPRNQSYVEKKVYIKKMLQFTLMYKKGHNLKHSKCILYGYGSYGVNLDSGYLPFIYELLNQGFLVAFAHIRGGGEFGFKGYDEGRLLNKKNTFYDFIDIIKYLYKHHYTTKDLLTIWGRSAGGLLISCVLNIEPDICHLAILGVPFITPILTMKNKHNPLGFESHTEFGDPRIPSHLNYLQSYDPLSNINPDGQYPNIFIYTNKNDTLVPYKESVMYYNAIKKINVFKQGKKDIDLFIDPLYGHEQGSSTEKKNESFARIIEIIYKYYKIE